jgi:ferredoxin, 2Fe-2S
MPRIRFIEPDGTEKTLDLPAGTSLMQAITQNDIKGVVAECGGSAMCATCHVYIPEEQLPLLPEMDFVEDEMLGSTAAKRRPNSRLSCQIPVTEELDGLVVYLPERQI